MAKLQIAVIANLLSILSANLKDISNLSIPQTEKQMRCNTVSKFWCYQNLFTRIWCPLFLHFMEGAFAAFSYQYEKLL